MKTSEKLMNITLRIVAINALVAFITWVSFGNVPLMVTYWATIGFGVTTIICMALFSAAIITGCIERQKKFRKDKDQWNNL